MARQAKPWYRTRGGAWYCTHDGRKVLLVKGPKAETAEEALREFHRVKAGLAQETAPKPAGITVAELLERFLDAVEADRKPGTYRWYTNVLKTFRAAHRDEPAESIRPHHLDAWARSMGSSRNYRRNNLAAVKAAFAWGRKMGLLGSDPVADTPKPPPERRKAIPLREEIDRLLEATDGTPFGDFVRVLADTGCRLGDAASIEARHVHWAEKVAVLDTHKTDEHTGDKIIPLTDRAAAILERAAARHPDGPLLRTTRGNPWRTWAVAHEFVHWRRRLGLSESLTAHGVRHRFVTQGVRVLPRPLVAALMGYSSTEVIDRIYDWSKEELQAEAQGLRAALELVNRQSAGIAPPGTDAPAQGAGPASQEGQPGARIGRHRGRPGR
jgi:integrase